MTLEATDDHLQIEKTAGTDWTRYEPDCERFPIICLSRSEVPMVYSIIFVEREWTALETTCSSLT